MKLIIFIILPFVRSFKLFNNNNLNRIYDKKLNELNNNINNELILSNNNDDMFLLKGIISISAIECLYFNHFMNILYPKFMIYFN